MVEIFNAVYELTEFIDLHKTQEVEKRLLARA